MRSALRKQVLTRPIPLFPGVRSRPIFSRRRVGLGEHGETVNWTVEHLHEPARLGISGRTRNLTAGRVRYAMVLGPRQSHANVVSYLVIRCAAVMAGLTCRLPWDYREELDEKQARACPGTGNSRGSEAGGMSA